MDWKRHLGIGLVGLLLAGCGSQAVPAAGGARVDAPAASAGQGTVAGAAAPGATARPTEKIVYALAAVSGVFVPPVLAQQKGFFREEGLEVELPVMRSNLIASGVAAGEVDYAGSFSPSVRNALSGMPMRAVAATVTRSTRRVMAVPSIQSMPQLRGQTIAVTTIGDGPYNSGVLALEHFGVDPLSEVTWVGVGGASERLLALQQGAAQATILSGPEVPRGEALGFVTLLRLDDVAPLPESGIATSLAKLESDRDQVKRVLRAMVRTLQYVKTDREGSVPAFMQFLSLTREDALEAYDGIAFAYSDDGTLSERSMRFTIEAEKKQLNLTEEIPIARVADFGPLYDVLADMGITPAEGSAR